jgi:UDPglucose 6-dehydrogenase
VIVYDPLAQDNTRAYFADNILYAESVRDCVGYSSVCVITTQEDEFKAIDHSYIVKTPTTIIDCWRILDPSKLGKKVNYIAIGKAS